MAISKKILKILRKSGMKTDCNPADYFFENIEWLHREEFYKHLGPFGISRIKWETSVGMLCQKIIREHISIESRKERSEGNLNDRRRGIELGGLEFKHDGNTYLIKDFQNIYPYASIYEDEKK